MVQAWERQPDETPKAFAAFRVYRGLGPEKRSLEAVAAAVSRKDRKRNNGKFLSGYIRDWSAQYNWVVRATAYDDHLDEVRRRASEKAIADMSRKHAEGMREIFDRGLARIKSIEDEKLSGGTALELAIGGMKGERLARGLTTDSVHQEVQGDLNVRRDDSVADSILTDPEATRLLCLALERASASSSKSSVVRDGGVEGPVGDAAAPERTER